MKHLIVAICVSMQMFLATDLLAAGSLDSYRSSLGAMAKCHWLIASNEDEQNQQQDDSAEEDDEPDCD
jgi:hypothetical protein